MTAATASGIAPRCTGMCSACAIIRPRSSNSAVEQSRRSLMLAEKEERMRTAPISSAIDLSDAPITWSWIAAFASLTRHDPAGTIPNPHPPGGNPEGRALEFDELRARCTAWFASRQLQRRTRLEVHDADGDELDLAAAIRVAVALVVRPVEPLREVDAKRHRQLERLAVITQISLTIRRQVLDFVK